MRLFLVSLILALVGAPAASARGDALASPLVEKRLFQDLDPYYAEVLLEQTAYLDALRKSAPDLAARYTERATALKDLRDMLDAHSGAVSLNEALRARLTDDADAPDALGLGFGARPDRLLAWRTRYPGLRGADAVVLSAALLEWGSLAAEPQAWFAGGGGRFTAASWGALSFRRRQERLTGWAKALYDHVMKSSPKTRHDLAQLLYTRQLIWSVLDGDQKRLSTEFLARADAAVEGLERLSSLPAGVVNHQDAAVRSLVDRARSGDSPEAVLGALSALFDKASVKDDAVRRQAPARPDQELSGVDPKLLGGMLASGLRAEIRDVATGRVVDNFFANHPLDIRVRELGAEIAHFEPDTGRLVFNARFVDEWVKSGGLTAAGVIRSPALFRELVLVLAPSFVHEATHQMQKAWAEANGLPWWGAQHQEIEAKETESVFVLEKEAKDPSYRKFLEREAGRSFLVAQTIAQAESLRQNPRAFPHRVMTDYYASLPSLERTAAATLAGLDRRIAALRKAADRIPTWGTPRPGDPWGYEDGMDRMFIESQIDAARAERARTLKAYQLSRRREEGALKGLESGLVDALLSDLVASREPSRAAAMPRP